MGDYGGWFVSIAVVVISGLFALASQRSAAKASKTNTQTVSAVERETEAYERARAFDTETITRQGNEIKELRTKVAEAKAEAHEARLEAEAARQEAADAKAESQEARAENLVLRQALADYMARDDKHNPHS